MRKFDTKVQHLKYKVLREVARLAWEDKLLENIIDIPKKLVPGNEPTMRCCVYKERAILGERVKLAMGGDNNNPNIIEVIEIACDECPVGDYEVTNACRGCLAHRCDDVCKFGAISFDHNHVAHIDKSKCKECGACAKVCPFSATFATQMLRYGMDVKTLACTIGHESVETKLNVYSHATDEGMRQAAERIDRAMGVITGVKNENNGTNATVEQIPDGKPQKPSREKFEPTKGKYRHPGTGSIHQVSKNVWEGRYSPIVNGKRIERNIYANSVEECEKKLAQMIVEMKEELDKLKTDGVVS